MAAASSAGRDRPEIRPVTPVSAASERAALLDRGDGGRGGEDEALVLDSLRALASQELDRGERFASKARQAVVFAAGFFAVVQTVVFNSFAAKHLSDGERHTLLILAIVAGAALVVCGISLLFSDGVFKTKDLSSDEIIDTANLAEEQGEPVARELSGLYATIVDERRETNGKRRWALRATQLTAFVTSVAVLIELIYALNARI